MSDTEEVQETKTPKHPKACSYPDKCPSRTFVMLPFKSNRFLVQTNISNWPVVRDTLKKTKGFKLLIATKEDNKIYAFVAYRHSVEIERPTNDFQIAKAFTTYWQNIEYICCKGALYDNINFEPKWTSDNEPGEVNTVMTKLSAKDALLLSEEEAQSCLTIQDYLAYCNLKK